SVDAIVVDFRGGFGGAGPEYAERLRRITRPKYLLIDDGVRSGKEWVTALVKRDQVATVVAFHQCGDPFLAAADAVIDQQILRSRDTTQPFCVLRARPAEAATKVDDD